MIAPFRKRKNKWFSYFLGIVSILLIFVLFFRKFISESIIVSYGDNTFLFRKYVISSWSPYFGNGMNHSTIISSYLYRVIPLVIFSYVGIGLENISKLAYFLPIILSLIIIFFILTRVSKSSFYGVVGALTFLLSGMTAEYLIFFPVPYFLFISTLFFVLLITYKDSSRNREEFFYLILIALLSLLSFHPFFFIIYVLYLLFYLIYNIVFQHRKKLLFILFTFLCIVLINFYWLLPFGSGIIKSNSTPQSNYGDTNLNGVYSAYLEFTSPLKIFLGSTYPVRYTRESVFNNFSNLASVSILFIFLLLIMYRYERLHSTFIYFLSLVFVIFFILSLGPNSLVIKPIWNFLWEYFPPFQFFRSFNRFSVILIPITIFSLAILYSENNNKKIVNIIITVSLIILMYSRKDLLNGDFGGLIPSYKIPQEYQILNSFLDENKGDNSRIISYPKVDYEINNWNRNEHFEQFQQIHYLVELHTTGVVLQSEAPNHTLREKGFYKELFDPFYCTNKDAFLRKLSKIDIDYVLLQKDLIDLEGKPVPYIEYKSCLDNSSFSLILSNEFFDFYKINHNSQFEKNYQIKETYPFYYQVDLDFKGKDSVEIVFPQNFNSGWKLYFDDSEDLGFLEKNAIPFFNKEIQVQHGDNGPGNKWLLNRNDFNDDNVTLHLYYYPQIYVVIGSVVSIFSIITLVTIGIGMKIKKIKKKKLINVQ